MKRIIDYFLLDWKNSRTRKSLLLRGARQIGKTYAARKLGETYESFIEVNLEIDEEVASFFEKTIDPFKIMEKIVAVKGVTIIPGKTLLFLDEIQAVPRSILALRYFYEMMPELHVIAAGSLLDFAVEKVGMPVGRVESLYMHPVSFIEFLAFSNKQLTAQFLKHDISQPIDEFYHNLITDFLSKYLVLGGMPRSIQDWVDNRNPLKITKTHRAILDSYRQDFGKYARTSQVKYVELVFEQVPLQLGQKFKYSLVEGDYRKRELAPALDLLITAGIVHKVFYSAGQGVPLAAQMDLSDYRVIFLDIGLAQSELGLDVGPWFSKPLETIINKGALMEAFVGQEVATYALPDRKDRLYYWHKDSTPGQAEIDYLIQINHQVIPVEVKAGKGRTLQSLQNFLQTHLQSPYGIRFSMHNYSVVDKIHSYPLYAIAQVMTQGLPEMQAAILALVDEGK